MDYAPDLLKEASNLQGKRSYPIVLVGCFILSFIFACGAVLFIGHYGFGVPRTLWTVSESVEGNARDDSAPSFQPQVVNKPGIYTKVVAGDELNPVQGRDYSLFVWFKLRRVPVDGESFALVGKFDASEKNRPGYAISLEGAPDGVRPRVYINSGIESGRWYSFSTYLINRKDWYLLVLSFTEDKFLSTYISHAIPGEAPIFLGGHRLPDGKLPNSKASLLIGAYGASRFRGQIGPFGLLVGEGIGKHTKEHMFEMLKAPGRILQSLPPDSIWLWASPQVDLGPKHLLLTEVIPTKVSGDSENKSELRSSEKRHLSPPIKSKKVGKRDYTKPVAKKAVKKKK